MARAHRTLTAVDQRRIGELVKAGVPGLRIAAEMGLAGTTVASFARKIRIALGMPSEREEKAIAAESRRAEVRRRSEDGQSDREIAEAMGSTTQAIQHVRMAAFGQSKFRMVKLTDEDKAEIDRRVLLGESTRAIAKTIGCSQRSVNERAKRLRHLVPADLPPCTCGKPRNHGGRCQLSEEGQRELRARIVAGEKLEHIAPTMGYVAQGLRMYAKPIIAELRAAGHHCPCGKEAGHLGMCKGDGASASRRAAMSRLRDKVEPLLRAGHSRNAIAVKLGVSQARVYLVAKPLLAQRAADGETCGCGQLIDHVGICFARFTATPRGKGTRNGIAHYKREARQLTADQRGRARRMLIKGRSDTYVARTLGCLPGPIKAMVRAIEKSGVQLPPCACGKPRNHVGGCRRAEKTKTPTRKRRSRPGATVPRGARRQIMELYKAGTSITRMAELSGVPQSTVWAMVKRWRESSRYAPPPCSCGKPAYHTGGCSKNTPNAIDKRTRALIDSELRAGVMPRDIAVKIGASTLTVLRHSADTRARMAADGLSCGCGRPVGHQYWCSASWDAHGLPRGRRPLPEPQESNARAALVRGDQITVVAADVGATVSAIIRLRATLDEAEKRQRTDAMRQRLKLTGEAESASLMSRVKTAVPRSLAISMIQPDGSVRVDTSLYDDVVAELQLAVLDGRLEVEQVSAAVRSFVSRGRSEWQSAYRPSLDVTIGDGKVTRGDLLADDTSSAAIDEIEIGQPPP